MAPRADVDALVGVAVHAIVLEDIVVDPAGEVDPIADVLVPGRRCRWPCCPRSGCCSPRAAGCLGETGYPASFHRRARYSAPGFPLSEMPYCSEVPPSPVI